MAKRDVELHDAEGFDQLIAAFVDDQAAGIDVQSRYPTLTRHFHTCTACRERVESLSAFAQADKAGEFGLAPSYLTFDAWLRKQQPLWKSITERAFELIEELTIEISDAANQFALSPALQSQLRLAPAELNRSLPRERLEEQPAIEMIELPRPESNLTVIVSMGAPAGGAGMLVVQVKTISPSGPIHKAVIHLLNAEGETLETAPTDQDGLVVFEQLALGKYIVTVEHAGETWRFSVTLSAINDSDRPNPPTHS